MQLPTPASCPLCGQPNQCAMAAGRSAHDCWCMTQIISPQALAQLPQKQRGLACICPGCGQATPLPLDKATIKPCN